MDGTENQDANHPWNPWLPCVSLCQKSPLPHLPREGHPTCSPHPHSAHLLPPAPHPQPTVKAPQPTVKAECRPPHLADGATLPARAWAEAEADSAARVSLKGPREAERSAGCQLLS